MTQSDLFKKIQTDISLERMIQSVKTLGQWHRYTGTEGGEMCVDYLTGELRKEGIPVRTDMYEAYVSLPLKAEMVLDTGETVPLIADVYSSSVENRRYILAYDRWSEMKHIPENENVERFASFRGKMVLTSESGGDFAEKLYRAGAEGMIHISSSRGGYIHHSNIGAEWGTPCASQISRIVSIPAAGISMEDGGRLINRMGGEEVSAELTIQMDTRIRKSRMPYVDIPGKNKTFVLINGHYDSWYEGITDNATSDAILLELARVFWKHKDELERGIRIAWWSGHSDARYAGSAWHCDHHFKELRDRCVANLNLDLTGCKNSEQVRARTTCMEGKAFTDQIIEKYTGMAAKAYIPMIRGADQSFWGARIPVQVMLKYEPLDEKRVSPCPSGGPWWHTSLDTLDKMDEQILLRDALMNSEIACQIVNSRVLPVKIADYAGIMREYLEKIQKGLSKDFHMEGILKSLNNLMPWIIKLESRLSCTGTGSGDWIIKRTAGELTRLVHTYGSSYSQDRSTPYAPFGILQKAVSMTRDNTPPELYLFTMTEFTRACNRIEGQLDEVAENIKNYLKTE